MTEKYTTKTLKQGNRVLIRSSQTVAKVELLYKIGCCTVTGIEVIYDNGVLEYFPRHLIPFEIELID